MLPLESKRKEEVGDDGDGVVENGMKQGYEKGTLMLASGPPVQTRFCRGCLNHSWKNGN
jgi:hypothetical protein